MHGFIVDSRSGAGPAGCNTCCCQKFSAAPGEVNKLTISYAPWSAPIGGHGLSSKTKFEIGPCASCGDDEPAVTPAAARTPAGEPLQFNLSANVTDPTPQTKYALLGLYGPEHGVAEVDASGQLTYTPDSGYAGIDRFWWSADGKVAEFVVAIDGDSEIPFPAFTPPVSIPKNQVSVDARMHTLSFALAISPGAAIGDIYRISILQPALDCDCNKFEHLSCYDLVIGKC